MIANYQGRTYNEEKKSGRHSLYKVWFIEIDPVSGYEQSPKYYLSFINRTNPKKAMESNKKSIEKRSIKEAKLIDNQTDTLLQVYENGQWVNPTIAQIDRHNSLRKR